MANATANDVRVWGIANGFNVGMTRGRLSRDLIAAFNEANGDTYAGPAPKVVTVKTTRKVTGKDGKVRTVPFRKTVSPADVRAFGVAHGMAKDGRGRLSAEVKAAYAMHLVSA